MNASSFFVIQSQTADLRSNQVAAGVGVHQLARNAIPMRKLILFAMAAMAAEAVYVDEVFHTANIYNQCMTAKGIADWLKSKGCNFEKATFSVELSKLVKAKKVTKYSTNSRPEWGTPRYSLNSSFFK